MLLEEAGLAPKTTDIHLEYKVKPTRGRGKASHTDLMAIDASPVRRALGIEAKWTESRYDTVEKWLKLGTSPENRRLVLQSWLDRLEPYSDGKPAIEDWSEMVYQMVHRAASCAAACGPDGHPTMAYLVFHGTQAAGSHIEDYRADLQRLRAAVGNRDRFPFFLASVRLHATGAFESLAGLRKGTAATGRAVRGALAPGNPPLFTFADPLIERV